MNAASHPLTLWPPDAIIPHNASILKGLMSACALMEIKGYQTIAVDNVSILQEGGLIPVDGIVTLSKRTPGALLMAHMGLDGTWTGEPWPCLLLVGLMLLKLAVHVEEVEFPLQTVQEPQTQPVVLYGSWGNKRQKNAGPLSAAQKTLTQSPVFQ